MIGLAIGVPGSSYLPRCIDVQVIMLFGLFWVLLDFVGWF
jgi:hypothetical protein